MCVFHLPPDQNCKSQRSRDRHDERSPVFDQEGEAGQQHVPCRPGQAADHPDQRPVSRVHPFNACEVKELIMIIQCLPVLTPL